MRTVGAGPEGSSFSLSQVAKVSPPLKIYSCYMSARCVGTGNTINSECLFSTFSAGTAPSCTPEGHMLRSKSCELSEAYYCSGHLLATSSQIELLVLFFVFLSVGPHHDMEMHITAVEQHYCKNKEHILYYITDGVVDIIITVYNILYVVPPSLCVVLVSVVHSRPLLLLLHPPPPPILHTQPCHTQLLQTQPRQTHTHTLIWL